MNAYRTTLTIAAAIVLLTAGSRADAPHVYAIRGARIVTAAGAPISAGTIVIRNGLIDAVGANTAAPADARIIDGAGMTVYPGLIDMGTTSAVTAPSNPQPQNPRTREEVERWKRSLILSPEIEAADILRVDSPELARMAAAGVTTVLATPPGQVIGGRSALVNVIAPADEQQIGALATPRRGLAIVRTPVALHVRFPARPPGGNAYPDSLMGVIAFVRQSFIDAQHYQLEWAHYERNRRGTVRPVYDAALAAMQPAIEGKLPVAFEADSAREILRALKIARDVRLTVVITGGREAADVAADLKAGNTPVLVSLNYPSRPKSIAPDADESVRALRERANAPKTPAALDRAGVTFAFASNGLKDAKEFVKNAAKAVREGLPPDAAIRALTITAAKIAGADDRLGSIEPGKIANLVVTEGDLFDEKMKVKHVFVDGRLVPIESLAAPREGRSAAVP